MKSILLSKTNAILCALLLPFLVHAQHVFYSKPAGDLHTISTWGTNPDGSGANPPDFGPSKAFYLANRGTTYTLTGNWDVGGTLIIPSGNQLQINGFTLSIADLTNTGLLSGTPTSRLMVTGSSGGGQALNFVPGSNNLRDLIINRAGSGAAVNLSSPLNIYGLLSIINGAFNTANMLTLKSQANTTAIVGPITGTSGGGASGQATLTHSQETVQGPLTTTQGAPRPLSFGTATFSLNAARTALTFTATIFNIDVTGTQTPNDNNDNLVAAHIHVGAPPGMNAPVRWGFFGAPDNDINPKQLVVTPFAGGVGGTFTSTWDLPEGNAGTTLATNLPGILNGLSYINFHTVQFGGGEVRGQISLVEQGGQTIKQAWQEGAATTTDNPNPGFGTHITGGPVFGSEVNGFDQNPGSESSLKFYDNPSNSWLPVPNTNATPVGMTPFMLFVRGNRSITLNGPNIPPNVTVLRARGNLITGNQTFNVAATGFTAIPNPYQSPINFATITKNNVQNMFWVWDPKLGGANGVGAYVTVSWNGSSYDIAPTPVSPISQYIQPWQSFLVRSTGTAGSLMINESDKVAIITGNVFRTTGSNIQSAAQQNNSTAQSLRVSLQIAESDGTTSLLDEVLASYSSRYSNDIDNMDALKMANIKENLALSREGQTLAIERRNQINTNDTLFLKLTNTVKGNYVLQLSAVNLANAGLLATLEDRYLHTSTAVDLSSGTLVPFSITADPASQNSDRFSVVFKAQGAPIDVITKSGFAVYPNPVVNGKINLQLMNQLKGTYHVSLINGLGQVVYQTQIRHEGGSANQLLSIGRRLAKGAYQLHVVNGKSKTTLQIFNQ